jgi:gluconate kinase
MLYITFGLPGAGKTYAARVFEEFGYCFHDGDDDLPDDLRIAIDTQSPVSDEMRDAFFNRIIASIDRLLPDQPNLVVSQTFIKEKYRLLALRHFPSARFVLVQAPDETRERRLRERTNQMLDIAYARNMVTRFEPPRIPYAVIDNQIDGRAHLRTQIARLLER